MCKKKKKANLQISLQKYWIPRNDTESEKLLDSLIPVFIENRLSARYSADLTVCGTHQVTYPHEISNSVSLSISLFHGVFLPTLFSQESLVYYS